MFILFFVVHKDNSEKREWTDSHDEAQRMEDQYIKDLTVDHYERLELEAEEGGV